MESLLKGWVERGEIPDDFYALVGKPRFHRERQELLDAVRVGYRFLQGYQCDVARRKFAAQLQRHLASARQVFEDDVAWKDYDESLRARARLPAAAEPESTITAIQSVCEASAVPADRRIPVAPLPVSKAPVAVKSRSHAALPALPRPTPPPVVSKPAPPPVMAAAPSGMPVAGLILGVIAVTAVVFAAVVALAAVVWALMSSPRPVRTTGMVEAVAVWKA